MLRRPLPKSNGLSASSPSRILGRSLRTTSRLPIVGTMNRWRIVHGFDCGSDMASAADLSLRYSSHAKPKRNPQFINCEVSTISSFVSCHFSTFHRIPVGAFSGGAGQRASTPVCDKIQVRRSGTIVQFTHLSLQFVAGQNHSQKVAWASSARRVTQFGHKY